MDLSPSIKNEFQILIDQNMIPENVMALLIEVKWIVNTVILKKIHKEEMLLWESFKYIRQLIWRVIFGVDAIDMWENWEYSWKLNLNYNDKK